MPFEKFDPGEKKQPESSPELEKPKAPTSGNELKAPLLAGRSGGRQFEYFYVKHHVIVSTGSPAIPTRTFYWTGIRLEKSLLVQGDLNKKLGLLLTAQAASDTPQSSFERETSFSAAARNGLVYELDFTIVPAETGKETPPYGNRYVTSVPVSADVSFNDAGLALRAMKFKLGPDNVEYIVQAGSIVQKKRKDTTLRYQL